MNTNGPLGDDWRFNVGGFYRYDHGVRDPGFPGISGGQVKASITRLLPNGYFRLTGKYINDRNQFILRPALPGSGRSQVCGGVQRLRVNEHTRGEPHPGPDA
jgi:hypothetical protein